MNFTLWRTLIFRLILCSSVSGAKTFVVTRVRFRLI